ncbi:MAG: hypothetical protein WCF25_04470 [Acidimicrobiales bacterium]
MAKIAFVYVRVPAVQVRFVRPFVRRHPGRLSKIRIPFVRVPAIQLQVFRPFTSVRP